MAGDVWDRIIKLATLATSRTEGNENEEASAAMQACEILLRNQHLLPTNSEQDGDWHIAPPKRPGRSRMHEHAARQREWRALLRNKNLNYTCAGDDDVCADCGQPIDRGADVIALEHDSDIVTHRACAGWWWTFEDAPPPPRSPSPPDDDIPF